MLRRPKGRLEPWGLIFGATHGRHNVQPRFIGFDAGLIVSLRDLARRISVALGGPLVAR